MWGAQPAWSDGGRRTADGGLVSRPAAARPAWAAGSPQTQIWLDDRDRSSDTRLASHGLWHDVANQS